MKRKPANRCSSVGELDCLARPACCDSGSRSWPARRSRRTPAPRRTRDWARPHRAGRRPPGRKCWPPARRRSRSAMACGEVLARHEVGQDRGVGRQVERAAGALQHDGADRAAACWRSRPRRAATWPSAASAIAAQQADEHEAPVVAVDDVAGHQHQRDGGQEGGEADRAERRPSR